MGVEEKSFQNIYFRTCVALPTPSICPSGWPPLSQPPPSRSPTPARTSPQVPVTSPRATLSITTGSPTPRESARTCVGRRMHATGSPITTHNATSCLTVESLQTAQAVLVVRPLLTLNPAKTQQIHLLQLQLPIHPQQLKQLQQLLLQLQQLQLQQLALTLRHNLVTAVGLRRDFASVK